MLVQVKPNSSLSYPREPFEKLTELAICKFQKTLSLLYYKAII